MTLNQVSNQSFTMGDLVTVKSMPRDEHFCIIGFKDSSNKGKIAVLKALFNDTYIIEKPVSDLQTLLIKGVL